MRLYLWIMFNKLIILPKFLQLIDPILDNISINGNKIMRFISIFRHEKPNNKHIINPKFRIMQIINNTIKYFQIHFFITLRFNKPNQSILITFAAHTVNIFKNLSNKTGINLTNLFIDLMDNL